MNLWLTVGCGILIPQRTMGGILDSVPSDGWLRRETLSSKSSTGTVRHRARALIRICKRSTLTRLLNR